MASGSNLDTQFAMQQMRAVWESHRKSDGKSVQMYRVVQSFGLDELNPLDSDDIAKANEMGLELASELYPDKQSLIVTQADGKGGKLHNHILVNSVGFVDGKSLRGFRKEHEAVADKSDELLVRHGMKVLDTDKTRNKRTRQEQRLEKAGKYVWKDDLRARIGETLKDINVTSRDVFIERLEAVHGVTVNYTEGRKNVSYSFADADGKKRKARDARLGTDYGKETLEERFLDNMKLLEAQQRRQEEKASSGSILDRIGFNVDAEVQKIGRPEPKPSFSPKVKKEAPIMKSLRLEKENVKRVNSDHAEALIENQRRDAELREAQQARLEAESRQRARIEAEKRKAQAEKEALLQQEQKERERKEQERLKAQRQRKRAEQRLRRAGPYHGALPTGLLDEFIAVDEKIGGTMIKDIAGKLELVTDQDIHWKARLNVADRKKAQRTGYRPLPPQEFEREL